MSIPTSFLDRINHGDLKNSDTIKAEFAQIETVDLGRLRDAIPDLRAKLTERTNHKFEVFIAIEPIDDSEMWCCVVYLLSKD
jgi:hypothetical protein